MKTKTIVSVEFPVSIKQDDADRVRQAVRVALTDDYPVVILSEGARLVMHYVHTEE